MLKKSVYAVLLASAATSTVLLAQTQKSELEEVVVTAHPLANNGTAQAVTVLSGEELARAVSGSLGETLSGEAGIQSASFGTAVGRPIIHGLAGARVKTTVDRIDTLDVSVTSGDHAVGVEPFLTDQVTVLRGSSTLLYGSGAIGGVVDAATSRIHSEVPEETSGRIQLRRADNADASNGAFAVDAPLGDSVVLHLDGFLSDADDYEIPGFAESAFQIAAEEAEEEGHDDEGEEHEEEEEAFGILEGSRVERRGGAIGLSAVGERGFVGFAVSSFDAEYGLVGGHGHEEGEEEGHDEEGEEHEEEEEGPGIIDLKQTRLDLEAQLNNPFTGVESINFRVGINDYEHSEIEPNGEVGTLFENDAWEGRVELKHEAIAGFDGALGLQLGSREFSAVGEEAFVPPVDSDTLGLFWVGQRQFGDYEFETGLRLETTDYEPTAAGLSNTDFDTLSASFGLVRSVSEELTLSALLDVANRAPTIEELFSNGPHLATQSFEIGDPNLQEEGVTALTLSAGYGNDRVEFDASLYVMDFSDYIYESNTGEIEDGLPLFQFQQNDALFTGVDLKGLVHLGFFGNGDLDLNFIFDYVKGEVELNSGEDTNLPRIPSSRAGFGLSWKNQLWSLRADYLKVDNQRRVATFELPTDGYEDLSLFVQRKVTIAESEVSLFLHGRNLTDDEQRYHGSIVKDFAPAPGRRFEVGIRLDF
jgi:iron complex outermembrane receptor protein